MAKTPLSAVPGLHEIVTSMQKNPGRSRESQGEIMWRRQKFSAIETS
jgi:hypothetical protein